MSVCQNGNLSCLSFVVDLYFILFFIMLHLPRPLDSPFNSKSKYQRVGITCAMGYLWHFFSLK